MPGPSSFRRYARWMRLVLVVALLVSLAGCRKPSSSCERAVKHLIKLTTHAGPPGSEPKADEQAAIDQIEKITVDACTKEGLSDAQRDCVLAAKSLMERAFLTCPALVAKPPSWIKAPIGHPEIADELEKLRQQPPPVDDGELDSAAEKQP
jgi:hypothetical protein